MAYQPKSYKKFVATAATATLVASAVAPTALAAFTDVADRYKDAVDYLATEGITDGYNETQFGTDDKIKRQDAAVMIARVLGATPEGDYPNAGFTDVPADRQWAVNFLADKKIVSGKAAGQFGANDFTQRDEMAKIIAGAYELVADETNAFPFTDVSETFKKYVDALNEAGIAEGYENSTQFGSGDLVTRGQFALFIYRAEGSPVATPTPTTPEVVSVSATNLKQVEIVFNNELDKTTAETLSNYKYTTTSGTASLTGGSAELQADGKTVVLTFGTKATQQEAGKVEVKNVTDSEGITVATVTKDVKFFDSTVPVVEDVTLVGPRLVKVDFSEPMNAAPTVKLDNGSISSSVTLSADKMSATVEFGLAPTEGSHELTISGGADFAGYAIESVVKTFNYQADTTAPTVSVDESKPNIVTLKFSKPVSVKVPGDVSVYHTINNSGSYVGGSLTAVNPVGGYADEFTVTFATPLPEGTSKVFLNTKANALEDAWGNDVASTELSATVVLDKVAPTATITSTEDSKFVVSYSEEVNSTQATNPANYTLKDSDGKAISLATAAFSYNNTTKKVTITLGSDLKAGTYQLSIKNVEDGALVPNKIVETTYNVVVVDTTAWNIAKFETAGTGKVRVTFSEAMSDTGLTTLSNYELVTASDVVVPFSAGATVTKLDSKTVLITNGDADENGTADAISGTVQNVRVNGNLTDVAGNDQSTLFVESPALTVADILSTNLDDVEVSSARTITFTVDNELKGSLNPAQFTLGSSKVVGGASYVNNGGEAVVTLTLRSDQADYAANASDTVTIATGALVNKLDDTNSAAIGPVTAANAISPSVAKLLDGTLDITQTDDAELTIVFTEALTETNEALYAQDLVLTDKENNVLVAGVDYTTDVTNGSATDLVVTLLGDYATDYTGPIAVGSKSTITYITDANTLANKANAFAAKSVSYVYDLTAPTGLTVTSPVAPQTVNAATFAITGAAETGSTVRVYNDVNNNGTIDAGDSLVASGLAAAGAYSIATPLAQDAANNFVVTSTDAIGNVSSTVDVTATITEDSTAPAGPTLAQLSVTATDINAATSAAEVGATWVVVADGALPTATPVDSGTVGAGGAIAGNAALTTLTAYDVYVIDGAGNVSTKLDITTP